MLAGIFFLCYTALQEKKAGEKMGDPLIRHIRKLYLQALISLLAVIGAIISFGLMIVSLISHSYAAAAFGAVFFLGTSLAIYID